MKKLSKRSIEYVLASLKILADNPYALLWELVEDFECNGHKISVKDSHQYQSVIIDNAYEHIGGNISITAYGKTYDDPLDYVKALLTDTLGKETESLDFGKGTKKEIREAIANKAQALKEDKTINIFNPGSIEYSKLEAAANLLSVFTGKKYYVDVTYFDHGQDWRWTTILKVDSSFGAIQVLTPKDQENILTADSATELGKAVDAVINKKPYI